MFPQKLQPQCNINRKQKRWLYVKAHFQQFNVKLVSERNVRHTHTL